jgi:predicted site-specific integrase-resolvase
VHNTDIRKNLWGLNMEQRAVVYCRVASPENAESSLEQQELSIREYLIAQGYEVLGVVKEQTVGLSMNRPGIETFYGMANNNKMEMIAATNSERFLRGNAPTVFDFVENMGKKGVAVVTTQDCDLQDMRAKYYEKIRDLFAIWQQ